jgi:hypothetical protein
MSGKERSMSRCALTKETGSRLTAGRLLTIAFGVIAVAGCSNLDKVATKSHAQDLEKVAIDNSGIVVIPNPYVDDLNVAAEAVKAAKQELIKRGYSVVDTEDKAQLVAIPTIETARVTVIHPSEAHLVDSDPVPGSIQQFDRQGTGFSTLQSLPSISNRSAVVTSKSSGWILVIEAFRKEEWDKALLVNELQLRPAWKFDASLPPQLQPLANQGPAPNQPVAANHQVVRASDTEFVLPQ